MQAFYQAELRPDLLRIREDAWAEMMDGVRPLCNCDMHIWQKKFHRKFTAPPSMR